MSNAVIIGKGPAGISAALYLIRAGIPTTVIGRDDGALGKVKKIENYYGFEQPVSGEDLLCTGIRQAERLGVELVTDEVLGITYDGSLNIQTKKGEYKAGSVVLATGSSRTSPRLPGLKELEGHGVSYCAVCDAFFYRGKDVAVLGGGDYAVHEAMELLPTSRSVTLLTNGGEPQTEIPEPLKICRNEIASLEGDRSLQRVVFRDGTELQATGLFVALGVAGSTELARKVGAATENGRIVVDENMATTVPGLFAAGDCTGGMLQIAKAVYEGAQAGTQAAKYLRKNEAAAK